MSHGRTFALMVVTFIAAVCGAEPTAAQPGTVTGARSGKWAHESVTDLQPDPRVVWGRLDNGLRYALMPYKGVPGRVSAQLIVLSGSLDETDDEQGIAHFMEHMVFRHSRNFTTQQKLEFFQRLGMNFGSDVSAFTTHESTTFQLEFHEATPDVVSQGMRLFRDFADGALFDPDEIKKELGVVLSEMRDRSGLAASSQSASAPVLYQGMRFPSRTPIGLENTLRAMDRESFLKFYHRCYRADLMVLVAAGDFEAPAFAAMLQERFGDMARPTTPVPPRDVGKLDTARGIRGGVFTISDVGGALATIGCSAPAEAIDSREVRAESLRRKLATEILNQRLQKGAPMSGAEASYDRMFGVDSAIVTGPISSEGWAKDIGVLDDLIRFTREKGFEKREVEFTRQRYLTQMDVLLEQMDVFDPGVLRDALANSIIENRVFTPFEPELQWRKEFVAKITPRELQQSFQNMWDPERMAFHISGEVDIPGGAAEVVKEIQKGRRSGLRYFRPDARKESVFQLAKWGPPTGVVETRPVPELGAKLFRFGNNVRVNFVRNRSTAGVVNVVARVGNGLLDMPENLPALKEFGLRSLLASGTPNYPPGKINQIIEDHLLYFSFDLDDEDAFTFRSGAQTEKIEASLGLITDFLDHPLFGTTAHHEEKMKAFISRAMSASGMAEGMRELSNHLFKGDGRLSWGDANDYIGLSAVDVRNWLEEPLTHGYVEVTIVGDITEEEMIKAVTRTLGSLPTRAATKAAPIAPQPVKVTAPPGYERIEFVGEQHLALVVGTWPIQQKLNPLDRVALDVLAKIMSQRAYIQIRADLGLAYSPMADLDLFSGFPDFALMRMVVQCNPKDARQIARLVEQLGDDMATRGVTENEFIGARRIVAGETLDSFRQGEFLMDALKRAQEQPDTLAEAIALRGGLADTVTHADVNQWTARILSAKNLRTAAIVPKPFVGIFQTGGQ